MATWLIVDSNYLCHRAHHTFGEMEHNGKPTGVVYGFLRDIIAFQELHQSTKLVFCFDFGAGVRQQYHEDYKANRRNEAELSDEEIASRKRLQRQIAGLRDVILKRIGFGNIIFQDGYEADDVIAAVLPLIPKEDDGIIISSDHDLWQLIGPRVCCWNPTTQVSMSWHSFRKIWKMQPDDWAEVKAIAGCQSDNVQGVRGVGEVTAAKYIRGELKPTAKAFNSIEAAGDIIKRNRKLVTLPYPGLRPISLAEDGVTDEKWRAVSDFLGMPSLRGGFQKSRRGLLDG